MLRQARIMALGLAGAASMAAVIVLLNYVTRKVGLWGALMPLAMIFVYCVGHMVDVSWSWMRRKR
jgi:hypothetical protein